MSDSSFMSGGACLMQEMLLHAWGRRYSPGDFWRSLMQTRPHKHMNIYDAF